MTRRATLLYDGSCEFCRRGVRLLDRLDWLNRLQFANLRDPNQWPESHVELDADRMIEEMHLVTPDGKDVYAGYDAFRWIAARMPSTWAIWPFLFIPGVPQIGRRIYAWVAKNRFGLVSCQDGACELPHAQTNNRASLTREDR